MGSQRRALSPRSRSAPPAALPSRGAAISLAALAVATTWSAWHLLAFVDRHAVDCLYFDQWDFLTPLFEGRGTWACFFHQHGPHREGIGLLLTAWLYDLTAWSTRAEGFLLVAILALAAGTAVLVAARLRGRLAPVDAVLPMLLLSTTQFEHIVVVPSLSPIILPVLLVLAASAACLVRPPGPRLAALALLHVLCTFTGYAVIGSAALLLAMAFHLAWAVRVRDRRIGAAAAAAALAALLSYAAFFHGYRFDPALPGWRFPAAPLAEYLQFVALQYAHALGAPTPTARATAMGFAAAAMVVAAAALACWRAATAGAERDVGRWSAVAVVALSSLGFAANAAVGRMPLGVGGALAHRYTPFALAGIAAVLLAYAAAGSSLPARRAGVATALLIAACVAVPPRWADRDASRYTLSKRRWVATYLGTGSVTAAQGAPGVVYPAYPDPAATRLEAKLRFLRDRRLNLFRAGSGARPAAAVPGH